MSDLQAYLDEALKRVKIEAMSEAPSAEKDDLAEEIGQLVLRTRTNLGITQKQLAERSGVSQSSIDQIENGSYRPSISVLKRIAKGFGKRLSITFDDWEENL